MSHIGTADLTDEIENSIKNLQSKIKQLLNLKKTIYSFLITKCWKKNIILLEHESNLYI